MSYRDNAGRTRQEIRNTKGEVQTVTINDPVGNVTYLLNPREKVATRIAVDPEAMRAAAEAAKGHAAAARERLEQMRKEGRIPTVERSSDGKEIVIRRVERPDGAPGLREDIRVRVAEGLARPDGSSFTVLHPIIAGAASDMKWSKQSVTKDLGTREIEGVKALGRLTSYEIPAAKSATATRSRYRASSGIRPSYR